MAATKTYLYEQIVQRIIKLVEDQHIEVGQRLPSERDLARNFDCSYLTVRKAIALMTEQQFLERNHGLGTYLRAPLEELKPCKSNKISFRPTNLLGLIEQSDGSRFSQVLKKQLIETAAEHNLELVIYPLLNFDESSLTLPQRLFEQGCRAVIIPTIAPATENSQLEAFIHRCRMPVVFSSIGHKFKDYNYENEAEAGITARREMRFACRYFMALGYERIVYLTPKLPHYNATFAKEDEYLSFMHLNHRPAHLDYLSKDFHEIGEVIDRLAAGRGKTAIICIDDDYALRLMTSMYRRSFSIPDDFALLGCNNIEESAYAEPPLSSFQFPYGYLAEMMIGEALVKAGTWNHQRPKLPQPEPVIRASCGGLVRLGEKLDDLIATLIREVSCEIKPEYRKAVSKRENFNVEAIAAET